MPKKINKEKKLEILALEDSIKDFEIISEHLKDAGFNFNISRVEQESEFKSAVRNTKYDIILADYKLPQFDAFEALRLCNRICPDVPFICVSGSIGEETAIEFIKQGAVDYVLKERLKRLPLAVRRALDEANEKEKRELTEQALRESQEQYRLIFDHSIDAILLSAPDGRVFSANPAACKILGRTEEEIYRIGRDGFIDVSDPRLDIALEERSHTGKFTAELTLVRGNGTKFPAEVTSALFKDKHGQIKTSMIVRDITERKRSEEKIRKLNRIYAVLSEINKVIVRTDDERQLFESTCRIAVDTGEFKFCWIGRTDVETGCFIPIAQYGFSDNYLQDIGISQSPDKNEICGPTETALLEKKYDISNDIKNDEKMLPWREKTLKRGYRSFAAFPMIRSGNVYAVINFYSSQTGFFDEEEVNLLKELSFDISYCIETIKQEKEKQKIEKERDRLYNYSIDMMCIAGFDGYFKQLNPAWEKTLGWANNELMSKPYPDFIHPEDRESTIKMIENLKGKEQVKTNFLNRFLCRDGTYKWLSWNLFTLMEERLIFSVIRDVTAFIKNETERKNLEAQLIQAQKLESLGTMAGGIAHDFNNILNIIMGYSSLLKSTDFEDEEIINDIEVILDASRRGADLVKQLLTFARKSESIFESVQLNSIINELMKLLKETFPKTIEIKYELEEDLPLIIADPTQIHQVFLNLCVNARDAMQEGGILTISTKHADIDKIKERYPAAGSVKYIELQVGDTGTGMDESTKQKIYEPFFTTKEKSKGTGLGLALVYGIIKNHGGYIDISSEVGKGTTFHIYLPAQEQARNIHQISLKTAEEEIQKGTGTILLIEDEELSSELMTTILVINGYKVITAHDGLQGIMAYRDHKEEITVAVTDLDLPKLDGEEVVKQIKRTDPEARIILISGYMDPEVKARMYETGIRHFIQKPYMPDKILRTLRNVLEEKE